MFRLFQLLRHRKYQIFVPMTMSALESMLSMSRREQTVFCLLLPSLYCTHSSLDMESASHLSSPPLKTSDWKALEAGSSLIAWLSAEGVGWGRWLCSALREGGIWTPSGGCCRCSGIFPATKCLVGFWLSPNETEDAWQMHQHLSHVGFPQLDWKFLENRSSLIHRRVLCLVCCVSLFILLAQWKHTIWLIRIQAQSPAWYHMPEFPVLEILNWELSPEVQDQPEQHNGALSW